MGVCRRPPRAARPGPIRPTMGGTVERHGSETYYVIGEGLLGESVGGRVHTMAAASAEAELVPPFRFSRMGPSGVNRQLGDPLRKKLANLMTSGPEAFSQIPSGYHVPRAVRRPRPDLRQDERDVRPERAARAAARGSLPQPRPRLALRRGPDRSRIGRLLRGGRDPPQERHDRRGRRHRREGRLRSAPRRGQPPRRRSGRRSSPTRGTTRTSQSRRRTWPSSASTTASSTRSPTRCPSGSDSRRRESSSRTTTSGCSARTSCRASASRAS